MTKIPLLFAVLALSTACGKDAVPAASGPATSAFALASEPAGAVSVAAAMAAAPKDDIVIVGRLREFTTGAAAFTFVDASIDFCGEKDGGKDETCPLPWDYCCHSNEEVAKKTILVMAKDAKGSPPAATKVPELRNLDLVVVKGRLVKDKSGNVELEATGWFRRERPNLPAGTVFPQ